MMDDDDQNSGVPWWVYLLVILGIMLAVAVEATRR